jgi:quinol monooxygenase YgiN
MSRQKVIVAGWFTVDPGKRDETVESFKDLMQRARSFPGCLDLAITADPLDPARVNNFELWQSEEALSSFRAVASPPARITPMLHVEMHKHVILESGPPF